MSLRKLRDLSYYFSVAFKSYFVPHHIHAKFYSQANWFRIYDGEAEEGLLIFPICLMSKKPRLVSFNTQTYIYKNHWLKILSTKDYFLEGTSEYVRRKSREKTNIPKLGVMKWFPILIESFYGILSSFYSAEQQH